MIHSTNTLCLVGSRRWDILLKQIDLSIEKGASPSAAYHQWDRLPDTIRSALQGYFVERGWLIDEPKQRQHFDKSVGMPSHQSMQPSNRTASSQQPVSGDEPPIGLYENTGYEKSRTDIPNDYYYQESPRQDNDQQHDKAQFLSQYSATDDAFSRFSKAVAIDSPVKAFESQTINPIPERPKRTVPDAFKNLKESLNEGPR